MVHLSYDKGSTETMMAVTIRKPSSVKRPRSTPVEVPLLGKGVSGHKGKAKPKIKEQVNAYRGESRTSIYTKMFRASPTERIGLIRKGVPAFVLVDIGADMGVTKERLLSTLQFPRATINRKIAAKDVLPPEYSERMIGLQKLIGQVEVMVAESGVPEGFSAAHWVAQWLEEPSPALGNARPADYMDTVEGQEMVAGLLLKMQTGAYA